MKWQHLSWSQSHDTIVHNYNWYIKLKSNLHHIFPYQHSYYHSPFLTSFFHFVHYLNYSILCILNLLICWPILLYAGDNLDCHFFFPWWWTCTYILLPFLDPLLYVIISYVNLLTCILFHCYPPTTDTPHITSYFWSSLHTLTLQKTYARVLHYIRAIPYVLLAWACSLILSLLNTSKHSIFHPLSISLQYTWSFLSYSSLSGRLPLFEP